MHRSSIYIWKAALSRDTLPPKPADLNEPQYINLAFSEHCHVHAFFPHIIFWELRPSVGLLGLRKTHRSMDFQN